MTVDAVGGVWTYALDLAKALESQGMEFVFAVMGPKPSDLQRMEVESLGHVVMEEGPYLLEWMDHPWRDVAAAGDWLLRLESRYRPDIVHLNGYVHAHLSWSVPVLVVAHSCVFSWWLAVKRQWPPSERNVYREQVMKGLAAADRVVAPSQAMRAALFECYGPLSSSQVIYNGRPSGDFMPQPKESFVFSMGRVWDEAKNIRLLMRAAAERPFPCVIAGDAADWHDRPESWPATRLVGHQSSAQVKNWLSRAAIYALPARYEPFGLSILEAALSGCAPIVGDIPSLREIWGDAATYVDPDDAVQLASLVCSLLANPAAREIQARRARERALRYRIETTAAAYASLYRELRAKGRSYPHEPARLGKEGRSPINSGVL
ncbi:MAG TPA: glycosyl transferase family 1 [Verrucomicrobia bacterium]|nr:glycosyl transferase family 1 [Verrucomicrobiota bacterium]